MRGGFFYQVQRCVREVEVVVGDGGKGRSSGGCYLSLLKTLDYKRNIFLVGCY